MAFLRFGGLKRFHHRTQFASWLLSRGLVLLVVNVALPLIFRHSPRNQSRHQTDRRRALRNEPVQLAAYSACHHRAGKLSAATRPNRRPASATSLVAHRSVHALAGRKRGSSLLPGLRLSFDWETVSHPGPVGAGMDPLQSAWRFLAVRGLSQALLIPPFIVTLLPGARIGHVLFPVVTGLNILPLWFLFLKDRTNKTGFSSAAALARGPWPRVREPIRSRAFLRFDRRQMRVAFIAAYACYWIWSSPRHPKLGIAGCNPCRASVPRFPIL